MSGAAKIIFLSVKNKFRLICETAKNKNKEDNEHRCSKNYEGPSTGMEAASIVEGFKSSESMYGLRYHEFIADGDSSLYKITLDSRPYSNTHIQKIECRNHLYRNIRSKFRDLSRNKKFSVEMRNLLVSRVSRIEIGKKKAVSHWQSFAHDKIKESTGSLSKDIRNSPFHVFFLFLL